MILQLPFLLDTSSDKHIAYSVWDHGFGGDNLLNLERNWEENRVCLIGEKTPWENKKGKPRAWSMKNLLNSMRKRGRKPICRLKSSAEDEKPLTPSYENEKENQMLTDWLKIRTRDCWRLWIKGLSTISTSGVTKGTTARRDILFYAFLIGFFV